MSKLIPIIFWSLFLAFLSNNWSVYAFDEKGKNYYIKKESFFFLIMAFSMAIFVGLRTSGNDTAVYRKLYEDLSETNISGIDWKNLSAAPGLQCYSIILKSIGASTQDYLMITAFITVGIYLWFIRKYTDNIFLSVFYFITMGAYTFTMAAIKQTMAVAFLLIATDAAIQKKWIRYLFWIVIAELFHPYAFIYLVVPLVTFRPWSKGTCYLLIGAVLAAVFMSRVLAIVDVVTESLGYTNYGVNEFMGAGVNIFRIMVAWVPLILSFLGRNELKYSEDREKNIIVNLMMVNAVIMFVGLFGTANYFARLANYFLIFQTIAFPYILKLFRREIENMLTIMSIAGFSLYYYYGEGIVNGGFDMNYNFMTLFEYFGQR